MNKKQKITFGLIVGLILLLTLGATYAYFSLVVKGNNSANNTVVTAGTLEITYAETNTITVSNIIPGWSSEEKIVTVTNTGSLPTSYNLLWDEIENYFIRKELLMSLACTSTGESCSSQDIPVTVSGTTYTYNDEAKVAHIGNDILIKENFEIEPGVTQTLTLKFYFKETGENQNYNQGKTFTGKLKVGEYKEIVPAGTLAEDWTVRAGYKTDYASSANTEGNKVARINFYSDGRTFNGITPVDVSSENNNSVKLYQVTSTDCSSITTDNGSTWTTPETCYEVNIIANGIIAFPGCSEYLFSEFQNANEINFNDSIYTGNVTNMRGMFIKFGYFVKNISLDLSGFNTGNVTNMFRIFDLVGMYSQMFELNLNGWDTSSVTNMSEMFYACNSLSTLHGIEKFDTSSVTDMSKMFRTAGKNATTFELDLSNWDVSNVTNFSEMFLGAGRNASIWNVGNISNWDTSSAIKMYGMFSNAGTNATYTLDLSPWNVSSVTDHENFNYGVTTKVIEPHWVN